MSATNNIDLWQISAYKVHMNINIGILYAFMCLKDVHVFNVTSLSLETRTQPKKVKKKKSYKVQNISFNLCFGSTGIIFFLQKKDYIWNR